MATLECACVRHLEPDGDVYACAAIGPFGYMCTEDVGHRSHHIACGVTEHFKEVWHDEFIAAAIAHQNAVDMMAAAN